MVRLSWFTLLVAGICNAADVPLAVGPTGFPDVSGGRWTIVSRADLEAGARAKGQPMPPLSPPPKFGEKFRNEPTDSLIVGDSSQWMANLAAYRQGVKRAEDVLPNTAIELVSLAGTPFERHFTLLGYIAEGTAPRGPWTSVSRMFAKPPGELVLLKEWDFGLDGGGVVLLDEMLNTRVGAARATFIVTRSGDVTQTMVQWISGTRQFELIAECRLSRGCADPDDWREIAGTIPAAPISRAMKPIQR
jgi:hypothetical protein